MFKKLLFIFIFAMLAQNAVANDSEKRSFDDFVAPVSNPVYFESPFHTTEGRLIHLHQEMHGQIYTALGKIPLDGELTVTALQLRYAVNERFSLIATKDGYARMHYDNVLENEDGFADLAFGFKYSPIIDEENDFILTLGFRLEVPTGDRNVFQGGHSVIANPFISAAKGFGNLHVIGYQGFQLPFNSDQSSTQSHSSLHVDYKIGDFYPLVELNWRHILRSGDGGPYDVDVKGLGNVPVNVVNPGFSGVDISNLGTAGSEGNNYVNWAFGFRYKFTDHLIGGFAFETPLSDSKDGLFRERYTFDMIYQF